MARETITNYTFNATTHVVTLPDINPIDKALLGSIRNVTTGETYYDKWNPQDTSTAVVTGTSIKLPYYRFTASSKNADKLHILYGEPTPDPGEEEPGGGLTEAEVQAIAVAAAVANAPVSSVAGKTGIVALTKTDVGLNNVSNTADTAKPVSTAQASAIAGKVAKGDLVVNVKDHGAVGNGAADDTLAITNALAELVAITGADNAAGILFFPSGKYLDRAVRAVPSNRRIHVKGAGMDTTIINRPSGSAAGDWWTFGARHSGISDLTMEGGRYQGVTGDSLVLNASYTYAERVWITKAGGNGITIGKAGIAIVHRLRQVQVRENAGRGIETVAGSGSTDGMWSDVEVGTSGKYGVYLGVGSQNISNLHVWQSGLESATEFDGIFIASGSNELVNMQSEKNLGRGVRIESGGNTVRGRCWGNCFGGIYLSSANFNEIDLMLYRNSALNTSANASDSYVQCFLSNSSTRNRIRLKVWDDTANMDPGNYVTAPTYPYPGRAGSVRTHTRALVSTNANCDYNVYDIEAPREITRLGANTAPFTTLGVNDHFSPSCFWGSGVLAPTQSVVAGVVRIPPFCDTIIVSAAQEITSIVGGYAGRRATIIWTNATPSPIRDDGAALNLNGDFTPTPGDTMTLVSDGTNWYELSRSTN